MIVLNLSRKNDIKSFLEKEGFVFKKALGQNFLIDESIAPRMAEHTCSENSGVIEIGPGAGVLTRELSLRAKKVVAIELDEKLSDCERVCVCANLPYYITSPVIMKLLNDNLPISSITVMVQKEAGDRICAEVGSRTAGAITAVINYYAVAKPLFFVPKESFLPQPKVNSEVISLVLRDKPPVDVDDKEFFFKTVNACFYLRRKTAINSISSALNIDKQTLKNIFLKLGIQETARGETFNMETLARLSEEIKNTCKV